MSIRDEIKLLIADGRLHELTPIIESDSVSRHMFVSGEMYEKLQPEIDGKVAFDPRFARLRADLEKFITGGEITVAHQPYKKPKKTYLARTDPVSDCIWDIRSIDPSPGIRVLGMFAEKDTFIALEWDFRERLDGPRSKEWRNFIVRCGAHWRRLFGTHRPHDGGKTSDILSKNYLDV